MASQTQFNGFGFGVNNVLSGIEGGFGFGFGLGTNLTLDVQTVILSPIARNLPYSLSYTDPADSTLKTISIIHDPAVPFQAKLPENVLITLTVPDSALYQALSMSITIAPNTAPVLRPRLSFKNAYARITVRYFY
jgi:hypothetical protein